MEHYWNDTDRGKLKYWEKTLHSVGGRWMNEYGALVEWYWQGETELLVKKPRPSALHKSRMDWPGIDTVPSR